ncbi:MAG: alpha/beta hydrolase [Isosphaeraceae bacterium]
MTDRRRVPPNLPWASRWLKTSNGSSALRATWKVRALHVVRILALVYLGLAIVLYTFQTNVIFPGASTQGDRNAQVRPQPGTELIRLETQHGDPVVALFGPALRGDGRPHPDPAGRPTLIYFYGNAMCVASAQIQFDQFRRLGLNVIIPDYVGYGMSGGRPSERGCEDTALAVYDYLTSNRSIPSSQILAGGWSLGAAVAIDLASRKPVAGLMVFSAFTSGVDMGRRLLPFLPVSLLLHHRFDNLSKIHQVGCPILIGHGRLDSMIPFSMAEKLAAAAKSPVTTLWIAQADHNDFFDVAGRRVDDAISEFVGRIFAR